MADNDNKKDDDVQPLFGDFVPGQQDSTQNPMMRAKEMMKGPLPKRFYKDVSIDETLGDDGRLSFRVLLDGRPIRSPAKNVISVPKRSIAEALQSEWNAQKTEINPAAMPLTRLINSTIDGVEVARQAMIDEMIAYLHHDFICYPASHPERLVERQKIHWLPVLDWAEEALGGRFVQASGITSIEQSPIMGERLRSLWANLDIFQLAAVHAIMTISGSSLLVFAFWKGFLDDTATWNAAMVDEDWNVEKWGEDDEATKRRAFRLQDYTAAVLVIEAFRTQADLD
ncbi:ATP12 family chaperone protein [Cohaesibacter celericrescens]|uniref:ATPase n=1 Tax=Cohaesibacter celericrescens TaxID=2067669 RepID=A0A2N5XVJ8_9HYPH|nr:ATP12 family protein [Cohaesibacter celericrescens]PLW78536.1 ATPase [Cohaesibacter celericrescens]